MKNAFCDIDLHRFVKRGMMRMRKIDKVGIRLCAANIAAQMSEAVSQGR